MLEIDVYFGLDKTNPTLPKVLVKPDPVASHTGGEVLWRFQSLDDTIDSVEVDFTDPKDGYFPSRAGGKPDKICYATLTGSSAAGGRQGRLLGITPSLGAPGARASKYTITAYRGVPGGGGAPIAGYKLDPTVVTVDP